MQYPHGPCCHYGLLKAMELTVKIFQGNIIHCPKPFTIEVLENGCLVVHCNKIIHIGEDSTFEKQKKAFPTAEVIKMKSTQILIPGLVDMHLHAPQYPNVGVGYEKSLQGWLKSYTFPTEASFVDLKFAKIVYDALVKKTLAYGTTTASYLGTIHRNSTMLLVEAALKHGQRAFVGKVNITKNAPCNCVEDEVRSLDETRQFIKDVLSKKNDLVKPMVAPRFPDNVTEDLMMELSKLAKEFDLNIQGHVTASNILLDTYWAGFGEIYDRANALTEKTILAHGVDLDIEELRLLKSKKTSLVHCPNAETNLKSGMCDIRKVIDAGIKIGLGTDISGGSHPSVIETMRNALSTSIHLSFKQKCCCPLTYTDVFYLATLGGARALSIDDKIGNFTVGKEFDALVVDMDVKNSSADYLKICTPLELLQKFVYLGDDRNVIKVYVNGKIVKVANKIKG